MLGRGARVLPPPLARMLPATRLLAIMAGVAVLLELLGAAGLVGSPFAAFARALYEGNFAVSSALAGSFVIDWVERPSRRHLVFALGAALAAVLGVVWRLHGSSRGFLLFNVSTGFGLVALGARARDVVVAPNAERRDAVEALAVTLLLPVFCVVGERLLSTLSLAYPSTLDGGLFLADRAFGDATSFGVGRAVARVPVLRMLVDVVYVELPLAYVVVSLLATRRESDRSHALLREFVLYGGASFLLLPIVPACGPVYAFDGFPNVVPQDVSTWTLVPGEAYRNCVPSMHTTWALLLFLRSRQGHVAVRMFALFWLAFTLLATLGKGEHYALDLIVAVPFLLALESIGTRHVRRHVLAVAAVTLASWLAALRVGVSSVIANPRMTLAAAIATVGVCAPLLWRASALVERAAQPSPPFETEPRDAASRRDAA